MPLNSETNRLKKTIVLISILIFIIGYTIGSIIESYKFRNTPIKIVKDINEPVGVVKLEGIYNGQLKGNILGKVRLFLGKNQIIPDINGAFNTRADDLFINYITIQVPKEMKFVASKKGKNYYPITSSAGEKIIPKNRIYFPDSISAEKAGFLRKKD